jgi:hypothetical protein
MEDGGWKIEDGGWRGGRASCVVRRGAGRPVGQLLGEYVSPACPCEGGDPFLDRGSGQALSREGARARPFWQGKREPAIPNVLDTPFFSVSVDLYSVGAAFYKVRVHFCSVGVDFYRVGVDFYRVGDDFYIVGVHFYIVGVHFYGVRVEFSTVGVDFSRVGVDFSRVGVDFSRVGVDFSRVGGGFSTMGVVFYRHRGCFWKREIPAIDEGRLFISYRRPIDEARRSPLRPDPPIRQSPNPPIPRS